jgi:hypothetical protein
MSSKENQVKVIGAGLGRTGTASFKKALEILGFGPCYHMYEVIENKKPKVWTEFSYDRKNKQLLHEILGGLGYQSTSDFPSCIFWKEQLELYPDAKVVLTVRDPEKWYKSCLDTILSLQPNHPRCSFAIKVCFWLGIPAPGFTPMLNRLICDIFYHGNFEKENVLKCHKDHIADVVANCPKEKLLVFEVSQGWAPLCEFLEVPIPDQPFPNVNDTKEFQRIVVTCKAVGYGFMIAVALTAAVCVSKVVTGKFVPFM